MKIKIGQLKRLIVEALEDEMIHVPGFAAVVGWYDDEPEVTKMFSTDDDGNIVSPIHSSKWDSRALQQINVEAKKKKAADRREYDDARGASEYESRRAYRGY